MLSEARAAELGLDLTARANAEFEDSSLLDDHFGQFPSLKMTRDIAAQEEIFVDYGEEWQHLMEGIEASGGVDAAAARFAPGLQQYH